MALSSNVVSQFAKLNVQKEEPAETTLNGVYKKMNGVEYVKIDGSDIYTPVSSTVYAEDGERVKVLLKEHTATVIGNITSPSARTKDVNELSDTVDEFGNTIHQLDNIIEQQGNSIVQINNNINQQNNIINQHGNAINQQGDIITSIGNQINQQGNIIDSMNNTISQHGDNITSMNNTINQQNDNIISMDNVIRQQGNQITQHSNQITQQGNVITQYGDNITSINNKINQQDDTIESMNNTIVRQGNTITQQGNQILQQDNVIQQHGNTITEQNSEITILNSGFNIIDGHLTGLSSAVINDLTTNTLNAEYAKINFANIGTAAFNKIFADSGMIDNFVMGEGYVTGELVGVYIKGDLVEANTLVADRIIFKGQDGLFYKLNNTGETLSSEQTNENSLNGQIITAKSITANKINVDDLYAFQATIGGFEIGTNSIHSSLKPTVNSLPEGLYMDSEGQLALGSENGYHFKYYKDENNIWQLDLRLNKLYIGSSNTSADQQFKSDMELSAEGLKAIVASTGGFNLLKNSVGIDNLSWWGSNGSVVSNRISSISESGSEFVLTGDSYIEQTYSTLINERYSVAFKYKITKSSQSSSGTVKVELLGQNGEHLIVFQETEEVTNWTKFIYKTQINQNEEEYGYIATVTNPTIKISCPADYIFEITDLIIAKGINDVWSCYIGESYGANYKLDSRGLRVYDTNEIQYIDTNSVGYNIKTRDHPDEANDTINAQLTKDRVYTDKGEFNKGYSIGKLNVMYIDANNIIEYIE